MNHTIEKTPLAETFDLNITHLPPQYNDPAWKALWLAYEGNEITLDTYLQFCLDFNFKPF